MHYVYIYVYPVNIYIFLISFFIYFLPSFFLLYFPHIRPWNVPGQGMQVEVKVKTYATPPKFRKPASTLKLNFIKKAKKLLTPPTSPEILTNTPKPIRMPDENKQLLRFCTVCASNQNRSMEAHKLLLENGFNVESFGTGSSVRLPGPSLDKPQVYQFGVKYDDMFKELKQQNARLYSSNGVLQMLDRNRQIKDSPQSWSRQGEVFDFVITCQERCFDQVCLDLLHRGVKLSRPVHVINVEIEDNHKEAALGAKAILDLVNMLVASTDPDGEALEVLRVWQKDHQKWPSMYQLCYF